MPLQSHSSGWQKHMLRESQSWKDRKGDWPQTPNFTQEETKS